MSQSVDLFSEIQPKTSYHSDGSEHGSGILGTLAKRVDALGHILTRPMSHCLDRYVRVCITSIRPNYYRQKTTFYRELTYRTLLFTMNTLSVIILLAPTLLGALLRTSVYLTKRDFIWDGPKEKQQGEETNYLHHKHISLITYNMAMMPQFVSTRNLLRPTMERAKEIPTALEDAATKANEYLPDFICGQEVFHTEAAEVIANELKNKGYSSIVRNVGTQMLGLNSGLFLASKHRLSNVCFYPHAYKKGFIENQANKGILIATAHLGKKVVVIANTHLSGGAPGGGALPRAIQIKGVMAHIDRYVQQMLTKGQVIEGVFLSADTNIDPTNADEESRDATGKWGVSQDPEWYLNPLLHAYTEEHIPPETPAHLRTPRQYTAQQALMHLRSALPSMHQIMNPNAWKNYLHAVKTILEGGLCLEGPDARALLSEELPKKLGGPFPPDLYDHDLDSLEKALQGSAIDMEFPSPTHLATEDPDNQPAATKPKRLDFNFVRTAKGFEHAEHLKQPKNLGSRVIKLRHTPSDHHPVRTTFLLDE